LFEWFVELVNSIYFVMGFVHVAWQHSVLETSRIFQWEEREKYGVDRSINPKTLSVLIIFWWGKGIHLPIPVAARSKAWVCGRSLAGIEGSNPAGGMGVCLLCVVR
jgi:hypothetical protein